MEWSLPGGGMHGVYGAQRFFWCAFFLPSFLSSLHPSSLPFAVVFPLLSLVWIMLLRTNIWISQYLGKCFVCSSTYVWMLYVASFKATHSFPYNMPLREAADLAGTPSRPTWQVPCEMEAETCTLLVRCCLTDSHKLAWKGPQELILFLSLLRAGSNTSLPFLTAVCLTSFWSPAVVQTLCSWNNLSQYFPICNHSIWPKIRSMWRLTCSWAETSQAAFICCCSPCSFL